MWPGQRRWGGRWTGCWRRETAKLSGESLNGGDKRVGGYENLGSARKPRRDAIRRRPFSVALEKAGSRDGVAIGPPRLPRLGYFATQAHPHSTVPAVTRVTRPLKERPGRRRIGHFLSGNGYTVSCTWTLDVLPPPTAVRAPSFREVQIKYSRPAVG